MRKFFNKIIAGLVVISFLYSNIGYSYPKFLAPRSIYNGIYSTEEILGFILELIKRLEQKRDATGWGISERNEIEGYISKVIERWCKLKRKLDYIQLKWLFPIIREEDKDYFAFRLNDEPYFISYSIESKEFSQVYKGDFDRILASQVTTLPMQRELPAELTAKVESQVVSPLSVSLFSVSVCNLLRDLREKEDIYLVSGDVDHLNKLNKIYGNEIMDWVIARISRIIYEKLNEHCKVYNFDPVKLTFSGDEFSICISSPKSDEKILTNQVCQSILDSVREEIVSYFNKRFVVAAITNLSELKEKLDSRDYEKVMTLIETSCSKFTRRHAKNGNYFLFKLGKDEDPTSALEHKMRDINLKLGDIGITDKLKAVLNWRKDGRIFNSGYLWTPTISMGGISVAEELKKHGKIPDDIDNEEQARNLFRMSMFRADAAVMVAKEERNKVVLGIYPFHSHAEVKEKILHKEKEEHLRSVQPDITIPKENRDGQDPRVMKEGLFKRVVYEDIFRRHRFFNPQSGDRMLIVVDAVYGGKRIEEATKDMSPEEISSFRGNKYGIGLRGINEILGHQRGDQVIKVLADSIIENIPEAWRGNIYGIRSPPVYRDVDRFFLYIKVPELGLPTEQDIANFLDAIQNSFNKAFVGIFATHIEASCAIAAKDIKARELFRMVEDTRLSSKTPEVICSNMENIVKQYTSFVEDEVLDIYEQIANTACSQLEATTAIIYAGVADAEKRRFLKANPDTREYARLLGEIPVGESNDLYCSLLGDIVDKDPTIVDLGTGTGTALIPVANRLRSGKLIGIDNRENVLEIAKSRFNGLFPNLKLGFVLGNANKLTRYLPEIDRIDAVIARYAQQWIDIEDVLPQIMDILKPEGKFIFNVWAGNFYGDSPLFYESNPFYGQLRESLKKVLEEELKSLPGTVLDELVGTGQIKRQDDIYKIVGPSLIPDSRFSKDNLRSLLEQNGFTDIEFIPNNEQYPVEGKRKFSLLNKSIPFYWQIMRYFNSQDRVRIIDRAYAGLPQGLMEFTDIFVTARKPKEDLDRLINEELDLNPYAAELKESYDLSQIEEALSILIKLVGIENFRTTDPFYRAGTLKLILILGKQNSEWDILILTNRLIQEGIITRDIFRKSFKKNNQRAVMSVLRIKEMGLDNFINYWYKYSQYFNPESLAKDFVENPEDSVLSFKFFGEVNAVISDFKLTQPSEIFSFSSSFCPELAKFSVERAPTASLAVYGLTKETQDLPQFAGPINIVRDTAQQIFSNMRRDGICQPLKINWVGIRINGSDTCPENCVYCEQARQMHGKRPDFCFWKSILFEVTEQGKRRGVFLDISGGEPTAFGPKGSKLVELIKYAKSLGMYVALSSNGILIDSDLARELVSSGLDNISITLNSWIPEVHNKMVRLRPAVKLKLKKDAYSLAINSMKLLDKWRREKGSPLMITVNTVVSNINYREFPSFVDNVGNNTPADEINICPIKDEKYRPLFLSMNQIDEWVNKIVPQVRKISRRHKFRILPIKAQELFGRTQEEQRAASNGTYTVQTEKLHRCYTALTSLHIDYNRIARLCSYAGDHTADHSLVLGDRDSFVSLASMRGTEESTRKMNIVPGLPNPQSTCHLYCGRDVVRLNSAIETLLLKKEDEALEQQEIEVRKLAEEYKVLACDIGALLRHISVKENIPLYRVLLDKRIEICEYL